jgi:hypothetical protein
LIKLKFEAKVFAMPYEQPASQYVQELDKYTQRLIIEVLKNGPTTFQVLLDSVQDEVTHRNSEVVRNAIIALRNSNKITSRPMRDPENENRDPILHYILVAESFPADLLNAELPTPVGFEKICDNTLLPRDPDVIDALLKHDGLVVSGRTLGTEATVPDGTDTCQWITDEGLISLKVHLKLGYEGFSFVGKRRDLIMPDFPFDRYEVRHMPEDNKDLSGKELPSKFKIPQAPEGFIWRKVEQGLQLIRPESIQKKLED